MSTAFILAQLERAGILIRFTPPMDRDETDVRTLLLSRPVAEFIRGNTDRHRKPAYFSRMRATLGEFVKGHAIPDDGTLIKHLGYDYGDASLHFIWEYRITFDPHSRLFGYFADRDTMLLIRPDMRAACNFRLNMERTRDDWAAMMGDLPPLRSALLSDCVSQP